MTKKPTRPEGLLARIELAAVHLREAGEELEDCAIVAGSRFKAARSQLRGARAAVGRALEAAAQATTTLTEGTVPLADGLPKKRSSSER